ncbi:MAG: valine--tRNA ligase [Chloroflexi bacterium]|nr:valine--tRNA ligase [Chloroflexota bacterium]
MTTMPKTYDFKATEQRLYEWWASRGWFKPEAASNPDAQPFVISIPPPNVTGELHLGHAMFVSVEDLMIRYQRMRGRRALWVPGTDHAGIATQLQIEKMLRDEGTSREAIGREQFIRRAWEWKEKYGGIITMQLRRLGASCDWDRERFTLDPGLSRAVREAFVRLYEKGLIYRGTYLINWSPGLKTAVSDLEVEYNEEQATLYYFQYRLKDSTEYIPVATTRPETIVADTAVAVHPDDERYRKYIGRTALVPILNREIPVIADEAVQPDFATGALKITPGHDPTDYDIGKRHHLPVISTMNPDATMNQNAGPYAGLDRFECRRRIWADMNTAGLTLKTEPYLMNVPRSQRGGEIVEPLISTQWFVRMAPLAEQALQIVRRGELKIVPERFEKVYFNWLANIRDWCISRQLWWGHRIPVWYCENGHQFTGREDPTRCPQCHSTKIEQDPDVLDTWFSSALWPFSTLGWPDSTPDLRTYYPTDVMETGYDILFFWVARMIMAGLEFTEEPPFHTVYLHGLVRVEHGRKMSKTLGNVVDPLVVMDEYGTDALRFTLLTGSTPGNDMNLAISRVASNRNFANKIWNAARFVISHLESLPPVEDASGSDAEHDLPSRWIRSRLNRTIADVTRLMDDYQFGQAGTLAYEFLWSEYCDWYVELSKSALSDGDAAHQRRALATLTNVLDRSLRLLHPFVPFVTEEVWQHLKGMAGPLGRGWPEALIIADWPTPGRFDPEAESDINLLIDIVRGIRTMRKDHNVEPSRKIGAVLVVGERYASMGTLRAHIARLANLDESRLRIEAQLPDKPANSLALVVAGAEIYLSLHDTIDCEKERARLGKELAQVESDLVKVDKLLASDFVKRAPPAVVQKERAKRDGAIDRRAKLLERLAALTEEPHTD